VRAISTLACGILLPSLATAQAPFSVGGDPRVDPNDFRVTQFASGLDNPVSMQLLPDGSFLVGTDGALVRLVDGDGDGVADGPATLLTSLPGLVASVRLGGELAFAAVNQTIFVLRRGATPADVFTVEDSFDIQIPFPWSHITFGLAVRELGGDLFELFFNVGSKQDDVATTVTVSLTGLVTGTVEPDSIYRVVIDDSGATLASSGLEKIASGVRNGFGIAFHPLTGDLYFEDNSIDGPVDPFEVSADELNLIALGDIGGAVEDFGFPDRYVEYRTGTLVGSGGIDPILAFQPIPPPNGSESEGPAEIRFAPPGFPPGLNTGLFVGFHGRFQEAGLANPDNPVVYVDLDTLEYFHFVSNAEPGIGHPDGLLATQDSLFVSDFTNVDGFINPGTGAIYQIKSLVTPPTVPAFPLGSGVFALAVLVVCLAATTYARFRK
jgi:glucose/arabinose dehydrogenase